MEAPQPGALFSECEPASDDRELRQGDVLESLAATAPDSRFGVVVTADCDIAQLKHNNTVSYVPLLPLSYFLAWIYVPPRLEKSLALFRTELTRELSAFQQKASPGSTAFSEEAVERWFTDADSGTIADTVRVPPNTRAAFIARVDAYREASKARGSYELSNGVAALSAIGAVRSSNTSAEKATETTWSNIHSYLKALPGDAFFIGSIGQSKELRAGFVAYLRLLHSAHATHVAVRASDLRRPGTTLKRIARLQSPYRYRLTQQLGSVFSSIGLPTEYESERARITTDLKAAP